ncbi:two-component system, OmpR family, phosphate regulon response regulator PhoB/two-component system, OmpR family, response regulator MtrA [Balnearium lithotrophicum]|uniref:Two-component system, OmpR family, phosphate regulon response regulator PhoB/two-component system, OmpR family, response regulator MtrA n=1 Tax=Balnearium lithotrophicum TaxID=223788 RepID=A0A521BSW4_9BACT|nr:response regulator transcription factor [Balnearium lithotrophicum]SMO50236.1 two-component system, OmpR family, phosphate regulon response regulator PhoB/two-component system, OmpR family, response regulator MtrA [Balnearium lithotrophicum]
MRVLLVEDDRSLAEEVKRVFEDYGIDVTLGTSRDDIFGKNGYSFLIFDLALLGTKGLEICRQIKEEKGIPIIVLSSMCDVNTKVKWFETGADDFVVKPFSTRELFARTLAIYRRYKDKLKNSLEFEGIVLKLKEGKIIVDGKSAPLTKIELEILRLLMKYPEEVLTKEFLLEKVWGRKKWNPRSLDVYIYRLRKKLGEKGKHIKTLTNVGYILTRNV